LPSSSGFPTKKTAFTIAVSGSDTDARMASGSVLMCRCGIFANAIFSGGVPSTVTKSGSDFIRTGPVAPRLVITATISWRPRSAETSTPFRQSCERLVTSTP
jgi:hypothetical protein